MSLIRRCLRNVRELSQHSLYRNIPPRRSSPSNAEHSRTIVSVSGRLDGSTDGMATSRVGYEEIKHDAGSIFRNERFLVSDGNDQGFVVNNSFVVGPILVLPYMGFLHWKCDSIAGVTADSLFLISRVYPKVETVLIGTGTILEPLPRSFRNACKSYGLGLHVESTTQAIQTYSVMLDDNRNFAALLLPASRMRLEDSDVIKFQKRSILRRQRQIDEGDLDTI